MFIVAIGSPLQTPDIYGPFKTREEAEDWAVYEGYTSYTIYGLLTPF